jgi:hypothetical protein
MRPKATNAMYSAKFLLSVSTLFFRVCFCDVFPCPFLARSCALGCLQFSSLGLPCLW